MLQQIKRVSRVLSRSQHLKCRKLQSDHGEKRLQFAEMNIHWKKQRRQIIFNDEKKLASDGPDGRDFYFHDLWKEEIILNRRQMKGENAWKVESTFILKIQGNCHFPRCCENVRTAKSVQKYFIETIRKLQIGLHVLST